MKQFFAACSALMIFVALAPSQDAARAPIQAPPNSVTTFLVRKVAPVYPPLARQTRVSGTVRLRATIGKDGAVQQLEVLSGHPLLVQSAMDAVKQWRYKPTLLNGAPVEVDTEIDVNFSLVQ